MSETISFIALLVFGVVVLIALGEAVDE